MAKELILSDDEKKVIKNNFFPMGTSNADMAFCMGVAYQFGLNPILNQIYFVKRSAQVNKKWVDKVSPMVGRDGFLTIAHKSGKFGGIETTTVIKEAPTFVNGEWVEQKDLIAICKVYRTDTERPFITEVAFKEYAGKTKGGDLTKFWKEKGATMLKKVAESQCLRKAFNVSGIYAEEELANVSGIEKPEEAIETTTDDVTALITEDMGGQNVNMVTGEVTEEAPAYMNDPANEDVKEYVEATTKQQKTLEIDV